MTTEIKLSTNDAEPTMWVSKLLYPSWPKLLSCLSFGGIIAAEDLPTSLDWGKYPLEVICVGILWWISTRTYPQMLESQLEAQHRQQREYSKELEKLIEANRENSDNLIRALMEKMDKQLDILTRSIKDLL